MTESQYCVYVNYGCHCDAAYMYRWKLEVSIFSLFVPVIYFVFPNHWYVINFNSTASLSTSPGDLITLGIWFLW